MWGAASRDVRQLGWSGPGTNCRLMSATIIENLPLHRLVRVVGGALDDRLLRDFCP